MKQATIPQNDGEARAPEQLELFRPVWAVRPLTKDQEARAERISRGMCPSCGNHPPKDGCRTCDACIQHDREYRARRRDARMRGGYVDEDWNPLHLAFTPRMLPVIGPRRNCRRNDECIDELVEATGGFGPQMQDPPGASCPFACPHFVELTRWETSARHAWESTGVDSVIEMAPIRASAKTRSSAQSGD